ncbi:hypothetical protein [Hydrogenimonas sp. SS33]|uniref:hypothetical protein n=1 Tax=Hydrogenimonas leucolamina TaxID=2954236 RepID=UPI00336BD72E
MRKWIEKLLTLSLIFSIHWISACADEKEDINRKIWKRVIFDLSLDGYRLYTEDRNMARLFSGIARLMIVDRCEEATLIVDTKGYVVKGNACRAIPRLTDNYRILLECPDEIGAFFWMKGRPTIIFGRERLQRFGLQVEDEMKDYVEDLEQ